MRALSLCTCCRHYPGTATGGTASLIRPVMSAFPERVVGSACASYFSRLARRSLALRPAHSRCHQFVARLPEGFRHFVTSMPAPVASGWSGCRAGLAPAGKRRLITAHTQKERCLATTRETVRPHWSQRRRCRLLRLHRLHRKTARAALPPAKDTGSRPCPDAKSCCAPPLRLQRLCARNLPDRHCDLRIAALVCHRPCAHCPLTLTSSHGAV